MPSYLIIDTLMLWGLGILVFLLFIVLLIIVRIFHSSYADSKDRQHYQGMHRSLLKEAEALARGLSYDE